VPHTPLGPQLPRWGMTGSAPGPVAPRAFSSVSSWGAQRACANASLSQLYWQPCRLMGLGAEGMGPVVAAVQANM
jgi:hypothetical protein